MQKDTAYINKVVKKKQHERSMQYHLENIKNVKPLTKLPQGLDININNRKKQYQNELRFTEIQRQNRILLQKISSIMNKTKRGSAMDHNSKSLNSTFRKRQNQDIQIQNAKLLKRLQQKKPNYDTQRLNKDWVKQKNVMKIMSNFPFMLTDRPKIKRSSFAQMQKDKRNQLMQPIQLVRMRVINGTSFLVTIQLSSKMLRIAGDCKERKQIKVIQIQRDEAIQFIEQQCHSKLQEIFNHLRYDKQQGVLYLVGNEVELDQLIAEQRKIYGVHDKQKAQYNFRETQKQIAKIIKQQEKQENPQHKQLNDVLKPQKQEIKNQQKVSQNKIKSTNEQHKNQVKTNEIVQQKQHNLGQQGYKQKVKQQNKLQNLLFQKAQQGNI